MIALGKKLRFLSQRKFIISLLLLALLGLLGNILVFTPFPGAYFSFGSIAVLLATYFYGYVWGTAIAILSSSYTYFHWGHPYEIIILTLEALFVGWQLHRKQTPMLLIDALYWVIAGIPLSAILYNLFLDLSGQEIWLAVLQQAVNGMANALVANLIIDYLSRYLNGKKKISLVQKLLNLLVACVFFPALTIIIWNSSKFIKSSELSEYGVSIYIQNLQLIVAISMLAMLMAVAISRSIVKPLLQLALVTENVNGEFMVDLPEGEVKEIDALRQNFEIAIASLFGKFEEVIIVKEQLVKERKKRKLLETSFKEKEKRYELAVSDTKEGVWDWNLRTNRVYYSSSWMTILGYENNRLANLLSSWEDNIHPEDRTKVIDEARNNRENDTAVYENVHRLKHRQGHYIWVAAKGKYIRNKQGQAYRLTGTITDITEQKEAAEKLEIAQKEARAANGSKEQLLAIMSHGITAPMNETMGMVELLLDTQLNQKQQEFVEIIRRRSDKLLNVINDILDFSNIDSGNVELEDQPFNLRSCLEDCLGLLEAQAKKKKIELVYWLDYETPEQFRGDATRLRQILVNLVSNGIEFTETGLVIVSVRGKIIQPKLEAKRLAFWQIEFTVQDTGIGIPGNLMDRLFKPFNQVEVSGNSPREGIGLGLAISCRLTEMMGGQMWVKSKGEVAGNPPSDWQQQSPLELPITSQGSTFFFTIEAAEVELKDSVSPEPDTIALVQQKSLRLLSIVENPIHRQILTLTAQSLAMVVRSASSALEALTWLQSGEEFDLAIIDLDMKKMSGNWLASQIQQRAAQLPLVMFTEKEQEVNKLNSPINWTDRLIKPIKRDQLAAIALSISQDAG